jgi:hypothetical protein
MATPGSELRGFTRCRNGFLRTQDCCGRFESHPEKDILAVANPSLNASGEIGPGAHPAVSHFEYVVMFDTRKLSACEA